MDQRQDDSHDEFFDFDADFGTAPVNDGNKADAAKTKRRVLAAVLAAVMLVMGFLIGWFGYYYSLDEGLRTFLWAKKMTERNYYKDIDEEKLYADLIAALESQLDPYSCFYTAREYERRYVVENSPAQLAGLKKGMYILAFGAQENALQTGDIDEFLSFVSKNDGAFFMRFGYDVDGSDGKVARVEASDYLAAYCYYRDSETSFAFRGGEQLKLVETHDPIGELPADTAYIRLDEFNGNAADEFKGCLNIMKERRRSNLILDLRSNGGGYLNILTDIAGHLLRNAAESDPIVATANYKSGKKTAFAAEENDFSSYFSADARVSVLADENTASASECLIGALVDYGTIGYGDIYLRRDKDSGEARSYGKGIMQSSFPSLSGDVMKLTVATVHWPVTGKCIQGVGVTEKDGAHAITAPLVWGAADTFLVEAIAEIAANN